MDMGLDAQPKESRSSQGIMNSLAGKIASSPATAASGSSLPAATGPASEAAQEIIDEFPDLRYML